MAPPPRKADPRALCEELEPRLLMSADAAGVLLGPYLAESAAADPEAHHALLDAAASQPLAQSDLRRELAFVDPGVQGWQQLVEELRARGDAKHSLEVIVLDQGRDGIEQIAAALEGFEDLDAVHVVSHGSEGALKLGNGWLTADTLESQPGVLASWGDALAHDGDLLFYGCDLAAGESGVALVEGVAQLTGADVAASVDVTGSALLGGDWQLEHQSGAVETAALLSGDGAWQGRLAVVAGNPTATDEVEFWAGRDFGQSFSHTSGDGTYAVGRVELLMREWSAATLQSVTVSIRETWDGPVLASDTVAASDLSTTPAWQEFDMGGVTLDDGRAYVIQVEASSVSGKVYLGYSTPDAYAGGQRLANGAPAPGDLAFRVDTLAPSAAPGISAIETTPLAYTEGDGAVPISNTLQLVNPGGGTLSGAAITITGNFTPGEDILAFQDTATIRHTWDPSGTLWLIGTDSVAAYQAALRSVTYENLSEDPSEATRHLSIAVADQSDVSVPASRWIDVSAVNDPPSVSDASFGPLAEDSAAGTVVGTVTASDVEAGQTIQFAIDSGNVGDAFEIDPATGVIRVKTPSALDFESQPSFDLRVRVSDDGSPPASSTANVTIQLADRNDPPVVGDQVMAVDENAPDGTVVGTVLANDPDVTGTALAYLGFSEAKATSGGSTSLTIPTPAGVNAGDLLIAAIALDDSHALGLVPPAGEGWNLVFASENAGRITLAVWAKTADGSEPAGHTFGWTGGDEAYGWIMRFSGQDSANAIAAVQVLGGDSATPTAPSVNAAVENSFILRIGAFENDDILVDQPGLDTHVAITMDEVGAVSGGAGYELQPSAGSSGTAIFALTNSRTWLAATLALQPEATDRLTYALTGGNADGAFAIDPDTGEIKVADGSLLDHEATASRDLTVTVTDSTGASASATVTIDVRDLNEAPSVSGGPFSVVENSPDGTVVGSVVGSDPDAGDTLRYAIVGGNPGGVFTIDDVTGEIRVADGSQLDYDTMPSFDLDIEVRDDGTPGLSGSTTVRVDLTDLNEAPSVSGGPFSVVENSPDGTVVGSVVGSDPDAGDTLRYAIVGGDPAGVFMIDAVSGEIRVADGSGLDFESTPRFDLQVEVTDGGAPALVAVTTVTIDVSDGNDAPTVSGGPFVLTENSPDGTIVGSVVGSDPDAGDTLRYAIVGGDPNGAFAIDPVTGEIRVADGSQLDYDTMPSFDLQVEVRDDGSPPQSSTAIVRVDLTGVNEAPIVSGGPFTVDENSANGTLVGRVSGTDPDAGDTIQFILRAGDPNGAFALDASTGEITVQDASQLDFESWRTFLLRIEARDDASPALSSLTTVRIDVADVNEAPSASNAFFSLLEGSPLGTEAGTVQGSDPDVGDVLRYVIVNGNTNNAFAIDPATGEITVANPSALDFEANPLFRLQVAVIDDGNPSLASSVEVVVFVRKLLEIPPVGGDPDPTDPGSETETPPPVEDPAEEPPIQAPPIAQTDLTAAPDPRAAMADAGEETTAELPAPVARETESRETFALASQDPRGEAERWTAPELLRELTTELPLVDQVFAELRADFLDDLERVRQDVVAPQVFETAVAGSSLSIAAGLSVGYALLLTRGGLLLASLVSSMPAWRLIDPLPVLSRLALPPEPEDPSASGESLDSMVRGGEAEAGAETPEGEISGPASDR